METVSVPKNEIAHDVLKGLTSTPKYLLPKYFYDDNGSRIFTEIMSMPEYYLTRCEKEILTSQKESLTREFIKGNPQQIELIELGSGDGQKTKLLLKHMLLREVPFSYIPVDISSDANKWLVENFAKEMPELKVNARTGDYFEIMHNLNGHPGTRRIVLFLGSNIGNFSEEERNLFLGQFASFLNKGDKVLMGFDLKKSPEVILKAYNDPHGHTRRFNINLLLRLNRELEADFDPDLFEHHATYDDFGFEVEDNFFDRKKYFVDSLWIKSH